MPRYYDADALLKELEREEDSADDWYTAHEMYNVVKYFPTADVVEPRWIPVSERLPENDDWQIVTIKDESSDAPYIYSDFGWYLDAANCWIVDAHQRLDIVAWMPLPEPYRKEAEDGKSK